MNNSTYNCPTEGCPCFQLFSEFQILQLLYCLIPNLICPSFLFSTDILLLVIIQLYVTQFSHSVFVMRLTLSWFFNHIFPIQHSNDLILNPLNPELNPICYFLALLAHHFLHVSRIRVKLLTFRLLMSYIYMEHPFLMFLDHTRRSTVGRTPLDE